MLLCKRVADLPGKDIHGAEHWWLETTRKSVGMGPAIDEECVDREMQLGEPTGVWIPGVNDCHTVVKRVIDKCHQETVAKALEAEAALVALYRYSFCMPLEAACHLGTAGACERLASALGSSAWTAGGAVASALVALVCRRRSARAAHGRTPR